MHTLQVKDIYKSYKKGVPVLKGASFSAHGGECIGILGANGSGKSTLLSIIAGCLKPDNGEVSLNDKVLSNSDYVNEISYVPQINPLIEELSARDNLRLWYGDDLSSIEDEKDIIGILGIRDFINEKVKNLSGGMKKRLSIAMAVNSHQPVLLLDEPGAALDLACKERIGVFLNSKKANGDIVIMSTHEEQEIRLCDRLLLLSDGVISEIEFDGNIHHLVGLIR